MKSDNKKTHMSNTTVELPVAQPMLVKETVKVPKPLVIPFPRSEGVSGRKPIVVKFHVPRNKISKIEIEQLDARKKPIEVYHLYPLLSEWAGRIIPDDVNPRSHDPECLKSPVAKKIENTIFEKPENFFLANRGSTLIVESLNYDTRTGMVELTIIDPENQGLADGATTDAVISKVQTALTREILENKNAEYRELLEEVRKTKDESRIPEILRNGRVHLEVYVGLTDRMQMADLVEGRNTSRQVKGWSMANFKGQFDEIISVIESANSPFKGKIGYEENSSQEVNILDVLSTLTVFHRQFDGKDENGQEMAPVVAYANKGRMDARLNDTELRKGYLALTPIILDALKMKEYIKANMENAYLKAFGVNARFGSRDGISPRHDNPVVLPLTGLQVNYVIPDAYIFPLLAAHRALVVYKGEKAFWRIDPFVFFDKYGPELVSELMAHVKDSGNSANAAGKRKLVYTALHAKARLCLHEETNGGKK